LFPLAALLLLSLIPAARAQAPVIISVAVPEFVQDLVRDNIITPFEEANPDIRVNIVTADAPFYNTGNAAEYLDNFQNYVSQADLLIVGETSIAPEATRAGYLLDLGPLVRADASFNVDDFYPQMWQSFQWDGGLWAIPAAGDVVGLLYIPQRFDDNALFYPDEFWTLAEFEAAARTLATVDESSGAITGSAFLDLSAYGAAAMLASLAGTPIFDPTTFDAVPDFSQPQLETLITEWKRLNDEGLFPPPAEGQFDFSVPLALGPSLFATASFPGVTDERKVAPLPGGRSRLSVNGLAISAGSLYPEQAYRLIRFTTESAAITTAFISALPARRSLVGVEADIEGNNLLATFLPGPDAEMVAELERLLETAYPLSEQMYLGYLNDAIQDVISNNTDVRTALQNAQTKAVEAVQLARDRAPDTFITVATPPPDLVLAANEVALNFGVETLFGGLPNQSDWQAVADEFAAADPQVGAVTLEALTVLNTGSLQETAEKYDCFYQSSNIVPTADLAQLRPVDPLVASDFNFDPANVVGGALEQLRRENQLWGVPLNIRPQAFYYNPVIFSENGAFPPYPGWTVGDFEAALRAIKFSPDDPAPFAARDLGQGGTYLLLLMAAYGGLPIDYRTTPPTIQFTDDSQLQAIQQVLDLARDGYIEYEALAAVGAAFAFGGTDDLVAMYSELLGLFGADAGDDTDSGSQYDISQFPQGTAYTAVSYDLGAGYISALSPNAEACYRFLTTLMQHSDLFGGMPVLRSEINNSALADTQGQATVDFYNAMDSLIETPGAVVLSSGFNTSAGGEALVTVWLFRAFDKYVAEDNTDLAFELSEAQLFADAYLECLAQIPPEDNSGGLFDRYRQWRECAIQVDPTTEAFFPAF
jgi:ABC-type glycerol-3-phosphate transport system substrate-binding protein